MRKITIHLSILFLAITTLFFSSFVSAQPYGKGTYNSGVPYGSETSLSISVDSDINIPITPTDEGVLATDENNVTVTSTDVMGYKLYIRSLTSTDMDNLGSKIVASTNISPEPLSINSWGYNTDSSTDFVGMTANDILIKTTSYPVASGEATTITYGINIDLSKPAGNYTTSVVYTAVPQTN